MTKRNIQIVTFAVIFLTVATITTIKSGLFKFLADEIVTTSTVPTITLPVNNERFVYTNTPLIQGKVAPNSNLNIYQNDQLLGQTTSDASGNFYFKPTALSNEVHLLTAKNTMSGETSPKTAISIDTSDASKAILKSVGTQIVENDHPYYGNGVNDFWTIIALSTNKAGIEKQFDDMEKAGIKMVRIINYMLRDMKLPDPVSAPTATVEDGGGLSAGSYIYRYTCANLSKNSNNNNYDTAETLPSPVTSVINVAENQKVTLNLPACAKSYRYFVYRRNATDAENSESLLGFAEKPAGQAATFVDNGTYRPADGKWEDPTVAPILTVEDDTKSTLPAGDYTYRYVMKQQRKPGNGRTEKFPAGTNTLASPTSQIAVASGQKIKVTIPNTNNGTFVDIYRRNTTDAENSEKRLVANLRVQTGGTIWYNSTDVVGSVAIPTANNTTRIVLPTKNETIDNPSTYGGKPFMTGFGNWNEEKLIDTDYALDMAQKHNIRLMFTFLDQHDNLTGGVREIARNCATFDSWFFTDTCSKDMTKQIIDKFTTRRNTITGRLYKDDPAIFSWEFINEPFQTPGGGNFRAWLYEMGYYLKSKDSNHMLASGDDGSIWFTHNYEGAYNANNNHDFVTSGGVDPIDLLTWHGYPESSGFMFNHGHYGEFKPDPVKDADWLEMYGPVSGPIDVAGAIKQLKLHSHYATLLQKPVVFGEWGVNWKAPTSVSWISGLSNAILNEKSDLDFGTDALASINYNDTSFWNTVSKNIANFTSTSGKTYNGHNSFVLSPKIINDSAGRPQTYRGVYSQTFAVKPSTKYWYDFKVNNPTNRTFIIRSASYYKNGQKVTTTAGGFSAWIGKTNNWQEFNRINASSNCEFTTPADVDAVTLYIELVNSIAGEEASIGELHFYELTGPTESTTSAFAGTGWWAWPDDTGLGNAQNVEALKLAAQNFAKASIKGLPALTTSQVQKTAAPAAIQQSAPTTEQTITPTTAPEENTQTEILPAPNINTTDITPPKVETKNTPITTPSSNTSSSNLPSNPSEASPTSPETSSSSDELTSPTLSASPALSFKLSQINTKGFFLSSEYIKITNTSAAAVNIKDWMLKNKLDQTTKLPSYELKENETITIYTKKTPKEKCRLGWKWYKNNQNKWRVYIYKKCNPLPKNTIYLGKTKKFWNRSHDSITLKTNSGVTIFSKKY